MKILLLSRYDRLGASSRIRSLQYLPLIESDDWQVDVRPLFSNAYLQALYGGQSRGVHVISGYWQRLQVLMQAKDYDLIWIEKEAFPFIPALAERLMDKTAIPYIVDLDDALFHRYDRNPCWFIRSLLGKKIDAVMRHAALVVVGNEYLAERAHFAESQAIAIIPTVVDLDQYNIVQRENIPPLTVGWIGSPATTNYLLDIAHIFNSLAREFAVRFVAMGASKNTLKDLPIEVWPWSEKNEVKLIQAFDIGIMPLVDSPWERGKCGYKLIQYMACGLPVVASSVGVNGQIVEHGVNGFLAKNSQDWEQALRKLLKDPELRRRMGSKGRECVETRYSLQIQAPRLKKLMRDVLVKAKCSA